MLTLTIATIVLFFFVLNTMENKAIPSGIRASVVFVSSIALFGCSAMLMGMIFLEAIGVPF